MSSVATSVGEQVRPARSPWFLSAPFDLLLILGVPFLTWPLFMAAQDAWGAGLLTQLILLTASGHYFATFVRAYGDHELFARFKLRFLLAPPLLMGFVGFMLATGNLAALTLVTAFWAFWHWLAQAFGFARIYDSKVGSFRPLTAWLDKALVITGFLGTVVLNDNSTAMFSKLFLDAGVPLPTAEQFAIARGVMWALVIGVGATYVGNLAWTIATGRPWSWQKQFMHVTTIGYYWFAFAYVPNVLIAHVLYEFFHDVQYFAITWITCRSRVKRPGTASWLNWMFRPGFVAAALFVAIMVAFGAVDMFGRRMQEQGPLYSMTLTVFLSAALLHYYYDGFIWKARESSLGSDLGIASGLRATMVPSLKHGARWGLLVVPAVALMSFGGRQFTEAERAEMLVSVAPGDFASLAQLGFAELAAGNIDAAIEHCAASVAANPDYAPVRIYYGNALELVGRNAKAQEQYEAALALPDLGDAHKSAYTCLGVLLLLEGKEAKSTVDKGMAMGGPHPFQRLYQLARWPGTSVDRKKHIYTTMLREQPNEMDARYELARLLFDQSDWFGAERHFKELLQRAPNSTAALVGLAKTQIELSDLDRARENLQKAKGIEPNNQEITALLGRLGG